MDKKVDTISFSIGTRRFEGQINMRRKRASMLDSETTFFGVCQEQPQGQRFQASDNNIDAVRRSLYEQAEELYGLKTWEKWVLIVVHVGNNRDWDIDTKRGMDAPRRQDLQLHVQVVRYIRSEIEGREIWSDYYQKVPKPSTNTIEGDTIDGIRMHDKYVGALLRDDERTRAFIERMKMGFDNIEAQMKEFLNQSNIESSIERILANPGTLLLEASDGPHGQKD